MKSFYQILVVALALVSTPLAQQTSSPLKSLVETEQAFSKAAEVQGTREAFVAYIADDGILYRPGAVNGKQWMKDHPLPPSPTRNLLAWQPIFARVASAGDLGYTTGPWEFKDNIKDEQPSGYGNFVTVWKKQPDGAWKFVVDLGISHPQSGGPQTLWTPPYKKPSPIIFSSDNSEAERAGLLDADRKFSAAALSDGYAKAFETYAAPDV